MNTKAITFIVFALLAMPIALAAEQGQTARGNPNNECQANGFDFGIAKWEWDDEEEAYVRDEGDLLGYTTDVVGDAEESNWTASPAVDGVLHKEAQDTYVHEGGTEGTITNESHDISHVTFCGNERFCEEGELVTGEAEPEEYDPVICGGEPAACGEHDNEFACEKADCEWENEGCVYEDEEDDRTCEDFETYSACTNAGCDVSCEEYEPEPFCGDQEVNQEWEQCDDGNQESGDGCSNECQIEQDEPICEDGKIVGKVGAVIDEEATADTFYARYTGNPAPEGYGHAYQWLEPSIASCDPNNAQVKFTGTIDLTPMEDGDVAAIGLLDNSLLGNGYSGWLSGAYIYINKNSETTVRIGPSDGFDGGEIVQAFDIVDIPEDGTLDVMVTIHNGTITVVIEGGDPIVDTYGELKAANNDEGQGFYEGDEFATGATVGWDSFPESTMMLYDLEVEGCGPILCEDEHDNQISVMKVSDKNGDGEYDGNNDGRRNNWTIRLYDDEWDLIDESMTGMTQSGTTAFPSLSPGTYHVCEVLKDGWHQSFQIVAPWADQVASTEESSSSNAGEENVCFTIEMSEDTNTVLIFGNVEDTIRVAKMLDNPVVGEYDNNLDGRLGNWTIRLYDDQWSLIDTQATDTAWPRFATFTHLDPNGTYYVCEVLKDGWMQTYLTPFGSHPYTPYGASVPSQSANAEEEGTCFELDRTEFGGASYLALGNVPRLCEEGVFHLDMEDGPENLYVIDPSTGVGTLKQTYDDGLGGVVAFDAASTLYGMTWDGSDTGDLVILNSDGTTTTVGATGLSGNTVAMEFSPLGTLYAMNQNTDKIYTIDTTSGAATPVHTFTSLDVQGGDLTVTPDAIVYVRTNGEVWTVDLDGFTETLVGSLPNKQFTSTALHEGTHYAMGRNGDFFYEFTLNPFSFTEIGSDVGPFSFGDGTSCPAECVQQRMIVSDTATQDGDGNASETWVHPAWTASIAGATWIWSSEFVESPTEDETVNFTRTFDVGGLPVSAVLDIATDNSYRVWLNGILVGSDADANNFQAGTQDQHDLTAALQFGTNTLTIEVKNHAQNGGTAKTNPAGLLYKLSMEIDECREPEPFCGDQQVNQEWEQCDGDAPEGFRCTEECQLEELFTCVDALEQGLITGQVDGNTATVQNTAGKGFTVSLAAYEMYSLLIEDQVLFDADTVFIEPNSTENLTVDLPACTYQIDLVCGDPIPVAPLYGDRVIDFHFGNTEADHCIPNEHEGNSSVEVTVDEGFPQCGDYVFSCDVEGFEPTAYYWYFGDGDIQPNSQNQNVWHSYEEDGSYTVACTATNGTVWQTGSLGIEVDACNPELTLSIHPDYPQENAYVFFCEPEGFEPTGYDWDFGDGEKLFDVENDNVYHAYSENGEYVVSCTASDGDVTKTAWLPVTVNACKDYTVSITDASPDPVSPEGTVTVSGTLELQNGSEDLSGEMVNVNGNTVGVLLNEWMTTVQAPSEPGGFGITATYTNVCDDDFQDSTLVAVENEENETTEENDTQDPPVELQTLIQQSTQEISSGGSGGGGDCQWGYHREGDRCVKDDEVTTSSITPTSGEGSSDGAPEEQDAEDTDETTESGNLVTGAVTGGGFGGLAWLWVLLALIGLLLGGYAYYRR